MAAAAGSLSPQRAISPPQIFHTSTNEEYDSKLAELGVRTKEIQLAGGFGRISPLHDRAELIAKLQSPRLQPDRDVRKYRIEVANSEAKIHLALQGVPCVPIITEVVTCQTGRVAIIMQNGGEDIFDTYLSNGLVPKLSMLQLFANRWLKGLSGIHSRGVLHRDVKAENFTHELILDFGISQKIGKDKARGLEGTPKYLSPEMVLDKAYDYKHDSFSFGALLFVLFMCEHLVPIEYKSVPPEEPSTPEEELAYLKRQLETSIQNQIDHLYLLQDALGELPQHMLKNNKDACQFNEHQQKWVLKPYSAGLPAYQRTFKERILSNERTSRYEKENIALLIDLIEKLTHLDPDNRITCTQALDHPFLSTPIARVQEIATLTSEVARLLFEQGDLELLVHEKRAALDEKDNQLERENSLDNFTLGPPALPPTSGRPPSRIAHFAEFPNKA